MHSLTAAVLAGGSKPGEELFYTQPGYPLDKRNASARPRRDLGFTLADTVPTLRAKEAGRLGLSADAYEKQLLEGKGAPSDDDASFLRFKTAVDSKLSGVKPGELDDAKIKAAFGAGVQAAFSGTFDAAVSKTLTREEEAFLEEGHDADALLDKIAQYQRIADEYAAVPNKVRHYA